MRMVARVLLATLTVVAVLPGAPLASGVAMAADVILSGAGATFPHPLYERWIEVYRRQTGVRIAYDAIGSGQGIQRLRERVVDFGATDAFVLDRALARWDMDVVHVPTCLGAVVVTYNLPGNPRLRFAPDVVADVFQGRITNWSDPRLQATNPGLSLPDLDITVIHRSDSSGTSFLFTDYLSKVSESWRDNVGRGKMVRWPVGLGLEGNPGVALFVGKIPGSVGYVELTYAITNHLVPGWIRNRAGRFIEPTLSAVADAAPEEVPDDTRILITNTPKTEGYPISGFTYLILYRDQAYNHRSLQRAESLVRFLWWAIHEGQEHNEEMFYARLPEAVVRKAEQQIRSISHAGQPVLE